MEKMNIRQAMLFLAIEFGFDEVRNTQDILELAVSIIQQASIEFTEDRINDLNINIGLKNNTRMTHYWSVDDDE